MEAGVIVAIAAVFVTIAVSVATFVDRRFAARDTKIASLEVELKNQDKIIVEKTAMIGELQRQRDDLRVTGDILNRFLTGLPPSPKRRRDDP